MGLKVCTLSARRRQVLGRSRFDEEGKLCVSFAYLRLYHDPKLRIRRPIFDIVARSL